MPIACGSITYIKSSLTGKALQIFCQTYHILDEVHPQLPNLDQTIHEMPTGKIGVYTRFFEYANFQLPLSTFLVDVLRYYRIHISQLSVIGAAKVSHFEVLCHAYGFEPTVGLFRCLYVNSKNKGWMLFSKCPGNDAVCYTKPLDSLKNWNDRFFWVDAFACPASFLWNTSKSVPKDPFPKSSEFNAEHYATLIAHPAPFHKSGTISLSKMDLLSFIHIPDPTNVRICERHRGEDEPKLLDTTVGRTVPLLSVTPVRAESELDASIDRLFDEGGSGTQAEQGDSAGGGGDEQNIVIQPVITVVTTTVEDVIPLLPRHLKKRKTTVSDAGKSSHPPKKLREDHETLSGASVGGKPKSVVQQLLVGAVQNVVVRGDPIMTLPFVSSSLSAMPEREEEDHTDSLAGANLYTIGASQRFVISSDSSHHSGANIAEAEADSLIRPSIPLMTMSTTVTSTVDPTTTAKDKLVESSIFGDGSSSGADHTVGGFSGLTGSDFIVGGIRTVVNPDTDIQKGKKKIECRCRGENLLLKTRDKEVTNLKAQLLVKEAEATEAIRLRAEVQTLADRNIVLEKEKGELNIKVADLAATVKVREQEVADLDVVVTSVKFHNDNFTDQVHKLEASSVVIQDKVTAYDNFIGQLEKFQDDRIREMNEKLNKLDADLVELALHSEERFYPHLLTTISGRRWLLTHGLELAIAKCLNSTKYISSLGAAIGKAFEKELKSNKDASVDTIMNLLRLEDSLAKRLDLAESQPHVDQLMVPIHHSPDQTVVGATSLLFSLDVSRNRVRRIKENIANDRSALYDVFVPLAEPLSIAALEGTAGTSGTAPGTTTALSVTFASTSTIPPISTDDYEIVHTDDQEGTDADGQTGTGADANPFPSIDDAELNVPE
ncbi:hypothetical protein Tco_0073392 [Tanacetum coccineum]